MPPSHGIIASKKKKVPHDGEVTSTVIRNGVVPGIDPLGLAMSDT